MEEGIYACSASTTGIGIPLQKSFLRGGGDCIGFAMSGRGIAATPLGQRFFPNLPPVPLPVG